MEPPYNESMNKLHEVIKQKRKGSFHNNARPLVASVVKGNIQQKKWKVLDNHLKYKYSFTSALKVSNLKVN